MKKISNFKFQISNGRRGFTQHHFAFSKKICAWVNSTEYKSKSGAGFTLVELLLYTVSVGLVLLIVSIALSLVMSSRTKNQTISEVESQGAFVMSLITQTVRNATSITLPAVGAPSSTLSVSVPNSLNSPTDFDLSGGIIRIIEDSDGMRITNSLTSTRITASGLNFANLSRVGTDGTIKIQFTLTYVNPGGRNEYEYAKTFYGSATIR